MTDAAMRELQAFERHLLIKLRRRELDPRDPKIEHAPFDYDQWVDGCLCESCTVNVPDAE